MYGLIVAAGGLTIGAVEGLVGSQQQVAASSVTDSRPRVDLGDAVTRDRAADAMALVEFDWETTLPEWTIDFVEGDSEIAGYTWSAEQRIEIFVRPTSSAESLHRVLAHEFGHAVDVSLNNGDRRRSWLAQRNSSDTQWWPANGKADFQTGAGDFAESFAVWMTGDSSDFRSELGPIPSQADLALIDEILATQR